MDDGQVAIHGDDDDGVDSSEGKEVHEHHQGLAQPRIQGPHARHGGRQGKGHDQHGLEQVGQQEVEDEAVGHVEELRLPLEHQQNHNVPKEGHAENEGDQHHLHHAVRGGGAAPGIGGVVGAVRRLRRCHRCSDTGCVGDLTSCTRLPYHPVRSRRAGETNLTR